MAQEDPDNLHKLHVVEPPKDAVNAEEIVLPSEQIDQLMGSRPGAVSPWRIFKIMSEFVEGYEFIRHYKRAATIFGSARCGFDDRVYKDAEQLGYNLAKEGFAVITGGGPGVMEAANKGANRAGGESVGLNIQLPFEQRINQYVNESTSFHYFFTRKVMLAAASQVYIFFPGGFGTFDEMFEMLTLVQTKKITPIIIVLVNKEFWQPLLTWINETVYAKNFAISEADTKLYYLVDSADEATSLINKLIKEKSLNHVHRDTDLMEHNPEGVIMPGACPVPEAHFKKLTGEITEGHEDHVHPTTPLKKIQNEQDHNKSSDDYLAT
jgi:uncharacterized protein (TIGR00730 family)